MAVLVVLLLAAAAAVVHENILNKNSLSMLHAWCHKRSWPWRDFQLPTERIAVLRGLPSLSSASAAVS